MRCEALFYEKFSITHAKDLCPHPKKHLFTSVEFQKLRDGENFFLEEGEKEVREGEEGQFLVESWKIKYGGKLSNHLCMTLNITLSLNVYHLAVS